MSSIAVDLDRLADSMRGACVRRYAEARIPADDDEVVVEFLRVLGEAGQGRVEMIKGLDRIVGGMLIAFAWRSATAAARTNSSDRILQGLAALEAGGWDSDPRDLVQEACALYHACLRIGIDPVGTFRSIAESVGGAARDTLAWFAEMPRDDASLANWRVLEGSDVDGFRYSYSGRGVK